MKTKSNYKSKEKHIVKFKMKTKLFLETVEYYVHVYI